MNQKVVLIFLFFLMATLNFSLVVHGEGEINLTEFPAQLASHLTIGLFPAQLLAVSIILMILETPVLLVSRKNFIAPTILAILVLSFSVGIGWLNYWFLLVVCMLIALLFAGRMRDLITGG